MMEIKITIEAGESLKKLFNLLQPKVLTAETSLTKNNNSENIKTPKTEEKNELLTEISGEKLEMSEEDYNSLRAECRQLGAEKRAEGKDVKALIKKVTGANKIAEVEDEDLNKLLKAIEEL